MAYSELIKSFKKIREYMRGFYVYGFKTRTEFEGGSARSYDNERRRIESWLADHMRFSYDSDGKRVFLSVDSRLSQGNPFYSAYKAKSFTVGDIVFHFYIMDMLAGRELTVTEITDGLTERLYRFENAEPPDESSIRKKLREYIALGLIVKGKRGRELTYARADDSVDIMSWRQALGFFSEAEPLGVIGSYLLDKCDDKPDAFRFKHHYILHALDSELLYTVLAAATESRRIEIETQDKKHPLFPIKVYISTQTGRQYILGYHLIHKKPMFFRLDTVLSVKTLDTEPRAAELIREYEGYSRGLWGVSTRGGELQHVELKIHVDDGEEYIIRRLQREKRCGEVTKLDEHTYLYTADVYDPSEMLPWLRTFIGRIVDFSCEDGAVAERFYADLEYMSDMYGGDDGDIQ